MRVGLLVASIAAVVGLASMIIMAIVMVRSGRGLEGYRTAWLVEYNWVGFLAFIVALVIALFAGLAFRWRVRQRWSELERKYGERDDQA
jgi:cellobiose-specific phosphotransferase system component IIC